MFSGCFEQRYAYFNVISRLFEDFIPLLMERFSMHCCFIPVISRTDEDQSIYFCFVICQNCRMEMKVNVYHPQQCFIPKGTTSLGAEYTKLHVYLGEACNAFELITPEFNFLRNKVVQSSKISTKPNSNKVFLVLGWMLYVLNTKSVATFFNNPNKVFLGQNLTMKFY